MTTQNLFTHKQIKAMRKITLSTAILFLVAFATVRSQYVMPSGGEDGYDWRVGTTQVISWSKYFMDTTRSVDILLWNADSASFSTIVTNISVSDEYYLWDIPSSHPTGEQFKVRVVYSNGFLPQFKYMSNDFFSIKEASHSLPPPKQPSSLITRTKTNSFKIYPNPASNELFIESDSKFFCIEIYDVNGSVVFFSRFDYTNKQQLNINASKLASGTYTVLVRFMGSFETEQLVITR